MASSQDVHHVPYHRNSPSTPSRLFDSPTNRYMSRMDDEIEREQARMEAVTGLTWRQTRRVGREEAKNDRMIKMNMDSTGTPPTKWSLFMATFEEEPNVGGITSAGNRGTQGGSPVSNPKQATHFESFIEPKDEHQHRKTSWVSMMMGTRDSAVSPKKQKGGWSFRSGRSPTKMYDRLVSEEQGTG